MDATGMHDFERAIPAAGIASVRTHRYRPQSALLRCRSSGFYRLDFVPIVDGSTMVNLYKSGDVSTMPGISGEPSSLDPAQLVGGNGDHEVAALLDSLTSLGPITYQPPAGLATQYAVGRDGVRYTFFLRGHPKPRDRAYRPGAVAGTRWCEREAQRTGRDHIGAERDRYGMPRLNRRFLDCIL
jgi:hypothetical protein